MRASIICVAGSLVLATYLARASAADFYALGDLPGGGFLSSATGLSRYLGVSRQAAGTSYSSTGAEAFYWNASEGMIGLGDLPGGNTESYATHFRTDKHLITGWSSSTLGTEAFVAGRPRPWEPWSMSGIGDLPGGDFFSEGLSVGERNGDQFVVGRSDSANGREAFLWSSSGGMQGLGDLPGGAFFSEASAINLHRREPVVFGQSRSVSGIEAFRWTAETGMVGLGTLPETVSSAITDAANPNVAVGFATKANGRSEAFLWGSEHSFNPGMHSLGTFGPGTSTQALGVDDTLWGTAVVGTTATASGDRAFIWTENLGLRDLQSYLTETYALDLNGWTLTRAEGIVGRTSTGDFITGTGINPNGDTEAWAAEISFVHSVPTPQLTAQPTTLPDGNVAWEIGLEFFDNRHSSAAIDLKFEGDFIQLDGLIGDVDDVGMANILESVSGFDKESDSWFYLDDSGELGAWTHPLPSSFGENNPADPPWLNNLGMELGLGGIDGLMPGETVAYFSAGTGARSEFISGPVAHFVLPPDATLTVSGVVARDGTSFDISQTFPPSGATVPEPSSLALLATGALASLFARCRGRRRLLW